MVVRQQRAREHLGLGAAHGGDAQAGPRLGHGQHREVGRDHALELLQHLEESIVRAHRAVDRLERAAQLLRALAPLALAFDGEGGIERAALARDGLAQHVHHLEPLRLAPGSEPALHVAQQPVDVQTAAV